MLVYACLFNICSFACSKIMKFICTEHSLNTLTNLPRNICWFTFICYAGSVSSTFVPDNEGFTLDELDSLTPDSPDAHGDPDVLGIHS